MEGSPRASSFSRISCPVRIQQAPRPLSASTTSRKPESRSHALFILEQCVSSVLRAMCSLSWRPQLAHSPESRAVSFFATLIIIKFGVMLPDGLKNYQCTHIQKFSAGSKTTLQPFANSWQISRQPRIKLSRTRRPTCVFCSEGCKTCWKQNKSGTFTRTYSRENSLHSTTTRASSPLTS